MSTCLFCRIVNGEIPAQIVYQDDLVVAFRDINPVAPTHILIVPRRHMPDLRAPEAGEPRLWEALIRAIQHLAEEEGLDGFRVVSNTGAAAGQSVFHLHLHLLGGKQLGDL